MILAIVVALFFAAAGTLAAPPKQQLYRNIPEGWTAVDKPGGECLYFHNCRADFPPASCKPTGLTPEKKPCQEYVQ